MLTFILDNFCIQVGSTIDGNISTIGRTQTHIADAITKTYYDLIQYSIVNIDMKSNATIQSEYAGFLRTNILSKSPGSTVSNGPCSGIECYEPVSSIFC